MQRKTESFSYRSPGCIAPIFDADRLENEVWTKIADVLNNPDKLAEVIKDSLQNLDKKAKLTDGQVLGNMDPDKYKELQSNLNKKEIRLKSLRANIHPSRLIELESVNETL